MGWEEKLTIDGMEFYMNEETGEVQWQKPEELMTEEEKEDNKAKWVWVPHKEKMWQPAKVIKTDDDNTVHVQLEDAAIDPETEAVQLLAIPPSRVLRSNLTGGRKQTVPLWELKKSNLRFLEDDLVMLDPVNEAFIIYNLQKRYESGDIYTWVGAGHTVLVSVNPYKALDLYDDEHIRLHRTRPPNKQLSPHVFDVANDSYNSMAFKGNNQSVLISGESGAGKTEATKQCLKYLASVAGSATNIEDKVLVANPLLEAFGNAKTIRNINSSRFGKWMEVYFDRKTTEMVGSKIYNYLLERSRVVYQQKDERNYHIFYALFADEATKAQFKLTTPEDYQYLSQSGCINVPQFDDARNFTEVMGAMDTLGFTETEKADCLQLVCGVLMLGNLEFGEEMRPGQVQGSEVKTPDVLTAAANMLQLSEEQLTTVLTSRTISAGAGKRAENATIPLNKVEAKTASDSLAMGVYGKLFQWLVDRVNSSLGNQDRDKNRFMGILDIFGFEIFDNNSFEQLCINYANEKLQQLFNNTTFKEEEQLYEAEGIEYTPIAFKDNHLVLEIIEGKPFGILPLLDDEVVIPEGDDKKFMNKIEDHHGKKAQFLTDPKRRFLNLLSFEIVHYAGVVKYDASKFMEKNVDTVYGDMHRALGKSGNSLLVSIFDGADQRIRTLSKQFRGQLDDLMNVLNQTESRFIRCIKPNDKMSANMFVARSCVEQLRYSGVFEAVDIRKTGYPFRYTHRRFIYRYSCINLKHDYKTKALLDEDPISYVQEILAATRKDFSEAQIGKTMVLYRANEYKTLRLLRNLALETLIPRAQSALRMGIAKTFMREFRKAHGAIEEQLVAANDHSKLTAALEAANNCFHPMQLRLFKAKPLNIALGQTMAKELEYWSGMEARMAKLAEVEDPNPHYEELKTLDEEMEATMAKQDAMTANARIDIYGRSSYRQSKLTTTQGELRAKMKELILQCVLGILDKDVAAALESFDRAALTDCMERADELKHDTEDIRKARELLVKIEQLDEDAEQAVKCVSRSMLEEVLKNAEDLRQNNDVLNECKRMLALDERSFVQEEYERAKAVKDEERKVHREIRLMELKYEEAVGNAYNLESAPWTRPRHEYHKNPNHYEKMLVFEKKLRTSLTKKDIELKVDKSPEEKTEIKAFIKGAKELFKHILMYMGDKKSKDKNVNASFILEKGLAAAKAGDNATLAEIYMLIMKQLRGNPTAITNTSDGDARTSTENGTSFQNGLALLGMCLTTFPPSMSPFSPDHHIKTFDDYVAIFILHHANFGGKKNQKRYIAAMHNTKYSKLRSSSPNPTSLRADFANLEGKFAIDFESDSGPKGASIELYLKEEPVVEETEEKEAEVVETKDEV